MLKRPFMIVVTAALMLGMPSLVSPVPPPAQATTMANWITLPSAAPGKSAPPCRVDGLCCAVLALLSLPEAPSRIALRLYSLSPPSVTTPSGIAIEPELSPPILSL